MIVLWKRRKQGENRPHDSPSHIYDIIPDTKANVSQHKLQSKIEQNKTAMNVISTLDAELGQQKSTDVPLSEVQYSDMQSNIAYGRGASSQQRSTDVTPGGVEYSDMQSNIAYGRGASSQQRATDVTPGGVEYSDMQSNIACVPIASGQCRDTEEHTSEVSTL